MQRAVDIPGLNALSLAEFARCREAAMFALESEGSQARQPVKPRGRIGDEGKHALSRRNDHEVSIGCFFDERKRTGARPVGFGRGSGLGRGRAAMRRESGVSLGSGGRSDERRGKRWRRGGDTQFPVPLLFAHQRQRQLGDVLLKGGHGSLEEGELMAQISVRRGCSHRGGSRAFLWRGGLGERRSEGGRRPPFTGFARKRIRQKAVMKLSEMMKLGWGETFETSIARMDGAREMGRGEPEPQGLGIDP